MIYYLHSFPVKTICKVQDKKEFITDTMQLIWKTFYRLSEVLKSGMCKMYSMGIFDSFNQSSNENYIYV